MIQSIGEKPTVTQTEDGFISVAMAHGFLRNKDADQLAEHCELHDAQSADAALALSLMQPWQVEATVLLMEPTKLVPGLELETVLGYGAAGLVFRAKQSFLDRSVAVKTINTKGRGSNSTGELRIQRESQAIAKLQHPNIVTAYDSGFFQGRFCITMELVEGESLAQLIERRGPLSEEMTWQIVRQAAAALSHAAKAGIIHRDIKPANLLLTDHPEGTNQQTWQLKTETQPGLAPFVKVADLGLALDQRVDQDNRITATGATLGTPAYVAPEQLVSTRVDCRADIFSLGATAFHMLTGEAPYSNQSPMRAILSKTVGDARWRDMLPATISPASTQLFRDMTEADADARMSGYQELLERIDRVLNAPQAIITPPKVSKQKPHPSTAKNPYLSLAAATALLLGISWVAVLMFQSTFSKTRTTKTTSGSKGAIAGWKPAGLPRPLFNGVSVPVDTVTLTNNWIPGVTSDGSRVLVGRPGSSMTIPLTIAGDKSTDVQLRFAVHLALKDAVVDFVLSQSARSGVAGLRRIPETVGLGAANDSPGPRLRFRLRQSHLEIFANSDRKEAETKIALIKPLDGDVQFRRIQLRRQGQQMLIMVNGQTVAKFASASPVAYQITAHCVAGDARFADIDIVKLIPFRHAEFHELRSNPTGWIGSPSSSHSSSSSSGPMQVLP